MSPTGKVRRVRRREAGWVTRYFLPSNLLSLLVSPPVTLGSSYPTSPYHLLSSPFARFYGEV